MVVKNEKSVEAIRDSLRRMERFFSGIEAQDTDRMTLVSVWRELVRMESRLQLFGAYRPSNTEVEC